MSFLIEAITSTPEIKSSVSANEAIYYKTGRTAKRISSLIIDSWKFNDDDDAWFYNDSLDARASAEFL